MGIFKFKSPVIRSLARLYLGFGAAILFFVIVFNTTAFYDNVNVPFTSFIVLVSSFLINIFGGTSMVDGTHLSTPRFGINVVDGCNGIYATAILLSGIIAYPSKIKHKAMGMLLGFIAIFALNLVRVITLLYMGQYFPDIFKEIHVFIWQPLIILWAIYIWYIWWKAIEAKNRK